MAQSDATQSSKTPEADPADISPARRTRGARPRIDRAALQLFVSKGIDAATTREIAEAAGVSEGALYRHYKGKEELAQSLFAAAHERMSTLLTEAALNGDSLKTRIGGIVSAYTQLADEDWLLISYHLLTMHRFLSSDIRRDDDPVSLTEALVKAEIEQGTIPPGDPELLAAMALGIIMQAAENRAYKRLSQPLSHYNEALTTAILAILMTRQES